MNFGAYITAPDDRVSDSESGTVAGVIRVVLVRRAGDVSHEIE